MHITIRLKGGPTSGNFGHAGRPGQIGGSSTVGSSYDRDYWLGKDVGSRLSEWEGLSVADRDKIANASRSVNTRIFNVTRFVGKHPVLVGDDVKGAITKRSEALKDLVPVESHQKIKHTLREYDDILAQAGLNAEQRYKLAMDATDILYVQDNEALGRQLGDHGIHHLRGNIDATMQMLDEHPTADTPIQKAEAYIAGIYHDTGYLTPPAHDFIDGGHPRWSMQHFDSNVRPMIEDALGSDVAGDLSHIIRTHDSTDLNWSEDTVGTSFRVADNTALFAKEKLPPLFRYVPDNIAVMEGVANKSLSMEDAKRQLDDNVAKATHLPPKVQSELRRAVKDTSPWTGKIFAMLGGDVKGYQWKNDHMVVRLKRNPKATVWQKFLDLGQKQFAKFAEAYGIDPVKFTKDLKFELTDNAGNVLLESVIE